jgi:hypothetical protein
VGDYSIGGQSHGYLLDSNGVYITLDYPSIFFRSTSLSGINNAGIIVGTWVFGGTPPTSRAFIATPTVPEPATGILVALAVVGGIVWSGRHRKNSKNC